MKTLVITDVQHAILINLINKEINKKKYNNPKHVNHLNLLKKLNKSILNTYNLYLGQYIELTEDYSNIKGFITHLNFDQKLAIIKMDDNNSITIHFSAIKEHIQ